MERSSRRACAASTTAGRPLRAARAAARPRILGRRDRDARPLHRCARAADRGRCGHQGHRHSRGCATGARGGGDVRGGNRLLLIISAATGVVVIAVAALVVKSWLVLGIAIAIHLAASTVVIGYSMKKIGETGDKPDPVSQARIEDERA